MHTARATSAPWWGTSRRVWSRPVRRHSCPSEALAALPAQWREASSPRKNSAADRLIDELASHPVVTSTTAAGLIGSSSSAIFTALARLEKSGVLVEITGGGREKVWLAQDVLDELDRLTDRIGRREAPPTVGHRAR